VSLTRLIEGSSSRDCAESAVQILTRAGACCELKLPDSDLIQIGSGEPTFRVTFKTDRALRAVPNELALARAYVEGDIDLDGDLMTLLHVRPQLTDVATPSQKVQFGIQLFLRRPTKVNLQAVNFHYTLGDDFYLNFIDQRYRFYSQCLFPTGQETLEQAAEHKLESMWAALELRPGMRLLDIGGGWGGVTEYCGARGVHVTTLTLADDSARYIRNLIHEQSLPGEVIVEDVLAHVPREPYDHAVIFGVIEHIPNYRRFCQRLWDTLKPHGRLYLDASAMEEKYAVAAFVRQYIYSGTHTFLALPDLIEELLFHGFEIVEVRRETRDYELTMAHWASRFENKRDEIIPRWGDARYRAWRMYLWSGAHAFKTNDLQAYHLVAERRTDPGPRPGVRRRCGHFLRSLP